MPSQPYLLPYRPARRRCACVRGKIPGIAGRVVGGIVGHQRLRRWQRPESVGLLSIVRPIIYSQLKVHRVSEPSGQDCGEGEGNVGRQDAILRAMHGVKQGLVGLK